MLTDMKSLDAVGLIILLQFGFLDGRFSFLGLKQRLFDVDLLSLFFLAFQPFLSLFKPPLPLALSGDEHDNSRSHENMVKATTKPPGMQASISGACPSQR